MDVVTGLETWVAGLSSAITHESPPAGNYLEVEPGTTVLAEPGQIIRSRADILWVRPVSEKLILAGDPELPRAGPPVSLSVDPKSLVSI